MTVMICKNQAPTAAPARRQQEAVM